MNKLMIPVVLAATGMVAGPAWSQAPAAAPALQNHRYFTMPLEKDPTREVGLQSVTMPPGAGKRSTAIPATNGPRSKRAR
jgi:hypothetical protein